MMKELNMVKELNVLTCVTGGKSSYQFSLLCLAYRVKLREESDSTHY